MVSFQNIQLSFLQINNTKGGIKIKNKTNKKIFVGIGIIILITITVFVIFFSESKQNNEKTPVQKTDESIELLFDNDAKNDDNVDSFMLYRTYTNNDYVLSLSNDEYVLMQPDNTNRFIGKFSYYNGNNVFDFVSKNELYNKYGLNSKKINMNNLFYVKAFYDTHIYNGIECYHKELNDNQELSFDFLVYFKETKEGKYLVATKLLNNPSIDFENAYF